MSDSNTRDENNESRATDATDAGGDTLPPPTAADPTLRLRRSELTGEEKPARSQTASESLRGGDNAAPRSKRPDPSNVTPRPGRSGGIFGGRSLFGRSKRGEANSLGAAADPDRPSPSGAAPDREHEPPGDISERNDRDGYSSASDSAANRNRDPRNRHRGRRDNTRRNRALPPPGNGQPAGGGGDTIQMRALTGDPARDLQRAAQRTRPSAVRKRNDADRVAEIKRRERRIAARFGFFSWFFGFFGLILRMLLLTILVFGLSAGAGYLAIRAYVKTDEVVIPNVKGMKLDTALDVLSGKRLAMAEKGRELSGIVAPGEIIDQDPPAGSTTKAGSSVRVVISSGRSNFQVPDLISETRENAINKIKGARLEVGNITYIDNDRVPRDIVISQSPEANKGLAGAEKVNLLLSSGPRGSLFPMPEVVGKPLSAARDALKQAGLTDITVDPPGAPDTATVTSQTPLVGQQVLPTERATLRVR